MLKRFIDPSIEVVPSHTYTVTKEVLTSDTTSQFVYPKKASKEHTNPCPHDYEDYEVKYGSNTVKGKQVHWVDFYCPQCDLSWGANLDDDPEEYDRSNQSKVVKKFSFQH